MKVLVRILIANGVYEPDWGVRNHRYGMAEYGCLLDDDWQHPQPKELKWIFARQGHVNYDTLYVCSVRDELERIAEKRDKFDSVGGALTLLGDTLSLTAEGASSETVAKGTLSVTAKREWIDGKYVDTNFTRIAFTYQPSMYVKVFASDLGECQNPNLDEYSASWWLLGDDRLPMGITHISHACSSLKLKQIWTEGLKVTRGRCVMFACHRRFTEMYKSSREGADCNIFVCPQILARYIEEGRMSAYFVILTHTLIVEFNYRDVSGFAMHSVPSKCF